MDSTPRTNLMNHLENLKTLFGNPMKTRVLYFAFAVAAAAVASSCVKEQAEPVTPEVEITGQVFEASHEAVTKSTLVGLTPTWVEGDAISVSGSDEVAVCTFVAGTDNKFQTQEGVRVGAPFYAVYPAAEGNTVEMETGVFTAAVPAIQKIDVKKEQNVAQGALVSVAYSETQELQFRNAVGLVKINIARNDIMAVKIEGLGENEFVAGQFTMKLNGNEEPEIALVEGTGVTSVTLNTVENYGMFTPGEYYATVLPCNLSGIKVTFSRKTFKYDENGEVTETGSETISVQKQSSAEIKRNAGTDLGTFFTYEISTAADLLAWNKAVAKWTVWDVVTLKENIDCSTIKSEDWTPNEFKGVFDGNGKTIDNLVIEKDGPAAFFSKLESATVKNLTFGEGCSFISTGKWAGIKDAIFAASLAADARGVITLNKVVNKGKVLAPAAAAGGSSANYLGGICASFDATGTVTDCENYGEVSFLAVPDGSVYCGGIFGETKSQVNLVGCKNHATVQFNGTNTNNKHLYAGGITADAYKASFNTCENNGDVQVVTTAEHKGNIFLGGIVGVNGNGTLGTVVDCVNKGAVTNNSSTSGVLRMGGFIGYIVTNPSNISSGSEKSSFKNYGAITNKAGIGNWTGVGGVAGYIGALKTTVNTVSGCENHGDVINEVATNRVCVGGIVGFVQNASTTVTNCSNHASVKNTGTAKSGCGIAVAGIVGRIEAADNGTNTISYCDNEGEVTFDAKNENDAAYLSGVAGILGVHTGTYSSSAYKPCTITISNCNNFSVIKKDKDGNNNLYVGGIAAGLFGPQKSTTHVANIDNCVNNSAASILNASTNFGGWYTYTGGIVGYHLVSGEMKNCKNYATVTSTALSSSAWDAIRVGGIGGSVAFTLMENCSNYGEVSDQSNSNSGIVGGVVGRVQGSGLTMKNCDNEGSVSGKFNNSTKRDLLAVGGIVGVSSPNLKMEKCDNTGDIFQYNKKTDTPEMVGGLVAYPAAVTEIVECTSNAAITSARSTYEYVGAFVGRFLNANNTITSSMVYGSFNGTELTESNYTTYCFGTKSENKTTTGLSFGKVNN